MPVRGQCSSIDRYVRSDRLCWVWKGFGNDPDLGLMTRILSLPLAVHFRTILPRTVYNLLGWEDVDQWYWVYQAWDLERPRYIAIQVTPLTGKLDVSESLGTAISLGGNQLEWQYSEVNLIYYMLQLDLWWNQPLVSLRFDIARSDWRSRWLQVFAECGWWLSLISIWLKSSIKLVEVYIRHVDDNGDHWIIRGDSFVIS